jgi:hypothetical protein
LRRPAAVLDEELERARAECARSGPEAGPNAGPGLEPPAGVASLEPLQAAGRIVRREDRPRLGQAAATGPGVALGCFLGEAIGEVGEGEAEQLGRGLAGHDRAAQTGPQERGQQPGAIRSGAGQQDEVEARGGEGRTAVVERGEGAGSSEQPAIDQEAAAVVLEQEAASGGRRGSTEEGEADRHPVSREATPTRAAASSGLAA